MGTKVVVEPVSGPGQHSAAEYPGMTTRSLCCHWQELGGVAHGQG